MLLYLFTLRVIVQAFAHLCASRHVAAALSGAILTLLALASSGVGLHANDLGVWVFWLKYVSPQFWMSHPVFKGEFEPVSILRCTSNPVITENSIIKQVPCGLPSGEEVIRYFGFTDKFTQEAQEGGLGAELAAHAPLLVTAAIFVFFQVLAFIFFLGKKQVTKMSRARKTRM